jgi:hypothetical protein
METVRLNVGSTCGSSSGRVSEHLRQVEFIGEKLGELCEMGEGRDVDPTRAGVVVYDLARECDLPNTRALNLDEALQ